MQPANWQDTTSQVIAGMLQWGANSSKAIDQQLLRSVDGASNLAESYRHGWKLMDWSSIAVIIQALLGSNSTLAENILSERSAGAQPQSGGGPGQPVSFPIQQPLPSPYGGAGGVYLVSATGQITKAA